MLGTVQDVCKTNRNCNTFENLYFDFYVSDAYVPAQNKTGNGGTDVRFGSKADIRNAKRHVRFVPIGTSLVSVICFSIADIVVRGRSYGVIADVCLVFLDKI